MSSSILSSEFKKSSKQSQSKSRSKSQSRARSKSQSRPRSKSQSRSTTNTSPQNQKYILRNLQFKKEDLLGEGTFSEVYKFRYNGKLDKKYVVKKIKVTFLRQYYEEDEANHEILNMFLDEVNAMIELSSKGITPKVYGQYVDIQNDMLYYVLQKLDYTFGHMLRENTFKINLTQKVIDVIELLMKTKYRHVDLHIDNIMYNESEKRFYLIDFGKQMVLSKKGSDDYFYTQKSSKDMALFDFTKKMDRSIIGSSGYSLIGTLYLMLLKENTKKSLLELQKLQRFIKRFVPKHKYKKVIETLEKQDLSKI